MRCVMYDITVAGRDMLRDTPYNAGRDGMYVCVYIYIYMCM